MKGITSYFSQSRLSSSKFLPYAWRHLQCYGIATTSQGCPRILNKKSSHTTEWIKRQITDRYVIKAQEDCYRSRAAYKLAHIDAEFSLLRRHHLIIDLGCYPGGWSQVVMQRVRIDRDDSRANPAKVIGVDKIKIEPLPHHVFVHGEVGSPDLLPKLYSAMGERQADVVLSDMAPACIGVKQDDHLQSTELCLHALDLAEQILRIGGSFVVKMFMGSQAEHYKVVLRSRFQLVRSVKPRASRNDSAEIYFICKKFVGREALSHEIQVKGQFSHKEGYY